jgi:hypothetical protein
MTAPVVQLFAWKTLGWSEAWNAEGEKGIINYYLPQPYAQLGPRAERLNLRLFVSNAWYAIPATTTNGISVMHLPGRSLSSTSYQRPNLTGLLKRLNGRS